MELNEHNYVDDVQVVLTDGSHFQAAKLNAYYWLSSIEAKEQQLLEAMNAVNINEYESSRDRMVSHAIYVEQESTAHLSFSTPLRSNTQLNSLYDRALDVNTGGTVGDTLDYIYQSWSETPAGQFYCLYFPDSFWYCGNP